MAPSKSFDQLLTTAAGVGKHPPLREMMAKGKKIRIRMDGMFHFQPEIQRPSHYCGLVQPILPSGAVKERMLACRWEVRLYKPWTNLQMEMNPCDSRFSTERLITTTDFNLALADVKTVSQFGWWIQHKAAEFYVDVLEILNSDIDKRIGIPFHA